MPNNIDWKLVFIVSHRVEEKPGKRDCIHIRISTLHLLIQLFALVAPDPAPRLFPAWQLNVARCKSTVPHRRAIANRNNRFLRLKPLHEKTQSDRRRERKRIKKTFALQMRNLRLGKMCSASITTRVVSDKWIRDNYFLRRGGRWISCQNEGSMQWRLKLWVFSQWNFRYLFDTNDFFAPFIS